MKSLKRDISLTTEHRYNGSTDVCRYFLNNNGLNFVMFGEYPTDHLEKRI